MFGLLKNVVPQKQQSSLTSDGFQVQSKERIVALLMRTSTTHVLFSVKLPGQTHTFSTAILGIYDEHNFIILDELAPEKGHLLLKEGSRLELNGRLNGVLLHFATKILEVRKKNGIAFYKSTLPHSLYYRQQRSSYRIPSRGADILFHGLRGKGSSQILKGYVSDLSREGIGVILTEEVELYSNEILPSCIVRLPHEGEVSFSMQVCFSRRNSQQQVTRLGGKFENIESESLLKIERLLKRMERKHAQSQTTAP